MTTFNTGNPIGSTDARDRLDNSENMDILENSTTLNAHADRLGTMRKTRKGMELEHDNQISAHEVEHDAQISAHEAEHDNQISAHEVEHDNQMQSFENDFDGRLAGMAFTRVGTFTAGATLTDMRQTLLWEISQGGDGHEYGWTGSFLPSGKVVAAGSTPATSGGVGAGAWVDRTDVTLRGDLNIVVKQFASVADMIADESLTVGKNVKTTAYYDGWAATALGMPIGGNDYVVVAAGTGTVDGGSFINTSNGLQLKGLFTTGDVTACQFGAKADGVTHDEVSINNALNFSKKVKLDIGTFAIASTIYYTNQELFGCGTEKTIIQPTGKFSALKYNGAYVNGGKLHDFMINFGSAVPVLADASVGINYGSSLDTNWPARYCVEDVYIRGASTAVMDDTGGWSGKYSRVWAQKCRLAFSKRAGTMTLFELCFSDACLQAWLCVNSHTVTLTNCAADSWNTSDGAIVDFNNCPSFCINGFQMESGVVSDNGIVLRFYNNSNGKVDGVNIYNTQHNITSGNFGSVIYSHGENTNITVSGLTIKPIQGVSGYTGTMRLLNASSSSKIAAKACYLGAISGGYGGISSGYAETGASLCLDETVEYESAFETGGDIRFGQVYARNGLKTLSSLVIAAGAYIRYEVPISGLLTGDMIIATPTFQSQGEIISARYYNANYASIFIHNPTASSLILNGNIYVQAIRHFSNSLS